MEESGLNKVEIESIKLLYEYAPKAIPFNFLIAIVATVHLFNQLSFTTLSFFLVSIFILSLLRYLHAKLSYKNIDWIKDSYKYYMLFVLGCFLNGLLWSGWYLFFVSQLSVASQYFMLLLLSGLATASMATMSSMSAAYFSYSLPMLALPACWYCYKFNEQSLSMAAILVLYTIVISMSYFRTQAFIKHSIKLNFENEGLIEKLKVSNKELAQSNKIIQALSLTDELTQIPNRRHFHYVIEKEWGRNQRTKTELAILIIDIDFFKKYNDALGHPAGDECLKNVASIIQKNIKRSGDFLARFGGEEFICVLPNTNELGAATVAHYIQQSLTSMQLPHPDSAVSKFVTLSIGVASMVPNNNMNIHDLINKADRYLYKAKSMGRNRIAYE